eukprot:363047-Chlamydomonas_euryale.AAC.4
MQTTGDERGDDAGSVRTPDCYCRASGRGAPVAETSPFPFASVADPAVTMMLDDTTSLSAARAGRPRSEARSARASATSSPPRDE